MIDEILGEVASWQNVAAPFSYLGLKTFHSDQFAKTRDDVVKLLLLSLMPYRNKLECLPLSDTLNLVGQARSLEPTFIVESSK